MHFICWGGAAPTRSEDTRAKFVGKRNRVMVPPGGVRSERYSGKENDQTGLRYNSNSPLPLTRVASPAVPLTSHNSQLPPKKPRRDRSGEMRTVRAAAKHPFREINCSCKKKCNENMHSEQRRKIHKEFWQLDANARRNFIYHRVRRLNKQKSTIGHVSRRDSTFAYSLVHPGSNEEISVCKVFFLTTLGFHPKNDAAVMSVMYATLRNASTAAADRRGKHTPSNKMDVTEIRQHILHYHPQVSHYRREHAPNRRYLPNDLTVRSMHDDYLEKFPDNPCSYETYRKCVSAENISFF